MKKEQRRRELEYLKSSPKLKMQAAGTKSGKLWHLESVVRQKIKQIRSFPVNCQAEYKDTGNGYVELLREISERILQNYNATQKTQYRFDDIVRGNWRAFLESGIISVLVTSHIPKIIETEFRRLLPENPKHGYPEARKMRRKFFLHLC